MKLLDVLQKDLTETARESSPKAATRQPGLTTREAEKRLARDGGNLLDAAKKASPFRLVIRQFKDILVLILLLSTAVSAWMGEYAEAAAIAAIVFLNAALGFIQEFRTERTLEALRRMAAPTARVYRDGILQDLPAADLAVGDVVEIEAGDRVPADGVLESAVSLAADESILTGESVPVGKIAAGKTFGEEIPEENRVYMGTIVTTGRGRACLTATGMHTKMGSIAGMLTSIREETTPLQKRLGELGKYIAAGCLIVCAAVAAVGILRGEDPVKMLLTGVSLAVAAVPEGLPATVTIALALAVKRMIRRHALIRRLHAVETLGCAGVICADKTGTLTQNRMTVRRIVLPAHRYDLEGDGPFSNGEMTEEGKPAADSEGLRLLFHCAVVCSSVRLPEEGAGEPVGDPTELALFSAVKRAGFDPASILSRYSRTDEDPFDSEKKYMTVTVRTLEGRTFLFAKGAPDVLLAKCSKLFSDDGETVLNRRRRAQITEQNESLAAGALRVLGFAYKEEKTEDGKEDGLVFLGLAGMIDPPRPEAKEAVRLCHRAGIRTVMITGDHRATAQAIAEQVGIFRKGDRLITGAELEEMSDDALDLVVGKTTVFARVSPRHKLRIVRALRRRGQIAAMTGDGVNDAPAVKEAAIGVSMGVGGSDVTKEASDLILLDDNFATLVAAVEEGRVIYDNIRKFIRYLLSCNIGEVLTMFLGIFMGLPVVLLPIQILLVNLVTDGLPAIALGLEPAEDDVMDRPPRQAGESVFSRGLLTKILFRGSLIGLTTLAVFTLFFRRYGQVDAARTAAFVALVFAQLIHVFECKSETKTLFTVNYFGNVKLLLAVLASAAVVLAALFLPPLQAVFCTVALSGADLTIILGFCLAAPVLLALGRAVSSRVSHARESGLRF